MTSDSSMKPTHDEVEEADIVKEVLDAIKGLESYESPDYTFLLEYADDVVSQVIESVPSDIRFYIWSTLPTERHWPVLLNLQLDTVKHLVDSLDDLQIKSLQAEATTSDVVPLADVLPDELVDAFISSLEAEEADELQEALSYSDDQVGRYINKSFIRVRPGFLLQNVAKRLRQSEEVVAVYVVDREGVFMGGCSYRQNPYGWRNFKG